MSRGDRIVNYINAAADLSYHAGPCGRSHRCGGQRHKWKRGGLLEAKASVSGKYVAAG